MSQPRHPFEMLALFRPEEWELEASCSTSDPDSWFPEKSGTHPQREVRRICGSCPVIRQCARKAIANDEQFGYWAGVNASGRRRGETIAMWRAISEGVAA